MLLRHFLPVLLVAAINATAQSTASDSQPVSSVAGSVEGSRATSSAVESSLSSQITPSGESASISTEGPTVTSSVESVSGTPTLVEDAFPTFSDSDAAIDPSVDGFLNDITVGYNFTSNDYIDSNNYTLGLITNSFNLTDFWCNQFRYKLYDSSVGGFGTFRFFNACVASANFTYDQLDGAKFSPKFKTYVLDYYYIPNPNLPGEKDAAISLASNVTVEAATFLHDMCQNIDCSKGIREKESTDNPCSYASLYVQNNWATTLRGEGKPPTGTKKDERAVLNHDNELQCQQKICQRTVQLTMDDADIGGVGVFLSYAFQLLIAVILIICGAIEWFASSIFNISSARRQTSWFHSKPFVNVLINFQKTQIFFVGALAAAAFIKSRHHSIGILDEFLLIVVTLNGMALLSLTLLPLYIVAPRSWYVYTLTLATFIMCLVFASIGINQWSNMYFIYLSAYYFCWDWNKTGSFQYGDDQSSWTLTERASGLVSSKKPFGSVPTGVLIAILAWCSAVMFSLLAHHFEAHRIIPGAVSNAWKRWKRPLNAIAGLIILTVYGCIVGLNVEMLIKFWKAIDHHSWGFGQIIALTVWIPVLADFVNDQYHEIVDRYMLVGPPKLPEDGYELDRTKSSPYKSDSLSKGTYYTNMGSVSSSGMSDPDQDRQTREIPPGWYHRRTSYNSPDDGTA